MDEKDKEFISQNKYKIKPSQRNLNYKYHKNF